MANVDYNKAYEMYTEKRCEMDAKAIEEEQKKLKRLRIGCYVLTAVSVIAAIYCGKKLKDVMGVVGSAVTDVSNLTYIDVQQAVVDKAVEKAANRAASKALNGATVSIQAQIEQTVTTAVLDSKSAIKKSVTDKIAKEVARIDKSELISDIEEQAKQLIMEKFDSKLETIASEYSRNLENMGKIYQNIAATMQQKA
jgi:hypothetical protein